MLIETSGSHQAHDEEKLNNFLQSSLDESLISDGVTTSEPGKMKNIWQLREKIADALINIEGYCFKYDISLPLKHFYEIVPATRERCGELASFVCGYGHVGGCENIQFFIFRSSSAKFPSLCTHIFSSDIFTAHYCLFVQVIRIFISTSHARASIKKFIQHCSRSCSSTPAN